MPSNALPNHLKPACASAVPKLSRSTWTPTRKHCFRPSSPVQSVTIPCPRWNRDFFRSITRWALVRSVTGSARSLFSIPNELWRIQDCRWLAARSRVGIAVTSSIFRYWWAWRRITSLISTSPSTSSTWKRSSSFCLAQARPRSRSSIRASVASQYCVKRRLKASCPALSAAIARLIPWLCVRSFQNTFRPRPVRNAKAHDCAPRHAT